MASVFEVPAFCDNCGAPARSGIALGERATNVTVDSNTGGRCPSCLVGTVRAVDGIYSTLESGVRLILTGSEADVRRLTEFLAARKLRRQLPTAEQIETFEPGSPLRQLLEAIPWDRNDVWAILQIILALLLWRLTPQGTDVVNNITAEPGAEVVVVEDDGEVTATADENTIKRVVDEYLAEKNTTTSGPGMATPIVKSAEEKIGRNDPCHCGSGKKFKHCHGR